MNKFSAVIQNLRDAGCDESFITKYIDLQSKGKLAQQFNLLNCHRCGLLTSLHEQQRKLDCLDYLIYQTNKSITTNND